MATMADVARLAGVSTSTVSHVLNGTRLVGERTRERVVQAISDTGYRHNVLARSLATSSTMALGVAMSASANPYFGDLIRSIESAAHRAGYMLMLGDTHDDPTVEKQVVDNLANRRVDGIIMAPSPEPGRALSTLESAGIPTVLLDRYAEVNLDQVAPENIQATAHLTSHLADLGHQRVAMVTGLPGLHSTVERIAGFEQIRRQRGLDGDPGLLISGASESAAAEKVVLEIFSESDPPTGIVVGNNAMTIGTMRALRRLRLTVPADVALVCYDDFDWADLFEPGLTAMRQAVDEMGSMAVQLMIARIAEPQLPASRLRVTPTYRHRSSCGCSQDAEWVGPV